LHACDSPFSASNRKTVPKHAPKTDIHPSEKKHGGKQTPETQT